MALVDRVAASPKNALNRVVVRQRQYAENWWFLDRITRQLDLIGVNFYMRFYSDWRLREQTPAKPANDMGWYMEPSALQSLLVATWKRYRKPVMVTENGLADANDVHREWWLKETMNALQGALQQGVDLRGYLHWSLLDNFEWAHGWWLSIVRL
jgi:beta-glucosidase/6-phospho-beta-glucosidase/beta-galactosidase